MDDGKRNILIASGGYICSKIFRRDFLLDEHISFREEYVLEDMDFIMEVFCKMHIIANVKEILYVYRDSGGSLSKANDVDRYLRSTMSAMNAIHYKLSDLKCYEGVREAVEYALLQLYSFSVNAVLKALKDRVKTKNEAIVLFENLRELKSRTVKGGYDNHYVVNKIRSADIEIMKKNDRNPEGLISYWSI